MKIFKFGSCRINYFNCNKFTVYNQIYYTHTTKEILQVLDFFNGLKNNATYKKAFPDNFNSILQNKKKEFKKSDCVLIEISSLKEVSDSNGFYYNSVSIGREYKKHKARMKKADYNELISDIKKIKMRINKKIIFQGHINLLFKNIGYVKDREVIDKAIIDYGDNYIIYKNIFEKNETSKVLINKLDICHLSKYGYKKLYNEFKKLLEIS